MVRATPSKSVFSTACWSSGLKKTSISARLTGDCVKVKHALKRVVGEPNPLSPVCDHYPLDHAGKNCLKTETLRGDLLVKLLEQLGNPAHVG